MTSGLLSARYLGLTWGDVVQSGQEDVLWYTEEVVLEPPLPEISGMPKSSALLQQLQAQPFFPITGQQMTEDAQVNHRLDNRAFFSGLPSLGLPLGLLYIRARTIY